MINKYAIVSGCRKTGTEYQEEHENTSLHSIFAFALYMSAGLSKYRIYDIKQNVAVNSHNTAIFYEPVSHKIESCETI